MASAKNDLLVLDVSPRNCLATSKPPITVLCVSDTHGRHQELEQHFPQQAADILIHAGDFTNRGDDISKYQAFNDWLGKIPFKHKVVIAGNHETEFSRKDPKSGNACMSVNDIKQTLSNCVYLHQGDTVVLEGLSICGASWLNVYREARAYSWQSRLPHAAPDILVTHIPPRGVPRKGPDAPEFAPFTSLDLNCMEMHWGCAGLRRHVQAQLRPRVHVFGHVHESYGWGTEDGVLYVNAASKAACATAPLHPPILLNLHPSRCLPEAAATEEPAAATANAAAAVAIAAVATAAAAVADEPAPAAAAGATSMAAGAGPEAKAAAAADAPATSVTSDAPASATVPPVLCPTSGERGK